jgi:hypothetical protein
MIALLEEKRCGLIDKATFDQRHREIFADCFDSGLTPSNPAELRGHQ